MYEDSNASLDFPIECTTVWRCMTEMARRKEIVTENGETVPLEVKMKALCDETWKASLSS